MVKDIGGLDIQNVFSNLIGQPTNSTNPATNPDVQKEETEENPDKSEENQKK